VEHLGSDHVAGDPTRLVRGEEYSGFGEVLGLAEPAEYSGGFVAPWAANSFAMPAPMARLFFRGAWFAGFGDPG